ncbi:MAG TPA: hypothetical protein VIK78_20585 [Ruminiclostridium sp.]
MREFLPDYTNIVKAAKNIQPNRMPLYEHSISINTMEDLINVAKIDAKHSNEDQIAPFPEWVNKYGDRIGNFGGIDTDHLCRKSENEIRDIVKEVIGYSVGHGGFALGSGNSIPNYVPIAGYTTMIETAREIRGE